MLLINCSVEKKKVKQESNHDPTFYTHVVGRDHSVAWDLCHNYKILSTNACFWAQPSALLSASLRRVVNCHACTPRELAPSTSIVLTTLNEG